MSTEALDQGLIGSGSETGFARAGLLRRLGRDRSFVTQHSRF